MKVLLSIGLLMLALLFPGNVNAQLCCSNADCGGQTCANIPPGCGPGNYGSCTGGGQECGPTAPCPVGYNCTNGNCVIPNPPGGGGGGGGTGDWCSSNSDCGSGCCNTNKNYCTNCSGFICPADPVACPPGTTRSTTITGTQCLNPKCTAGSAQTIGNCCSGHWNKGACSDWYECPTKSNPNKVCRDCEPDVYVCTSQEYVTYQCNPVCTATSPSNVSVTPISLTSSRVTWTPGVSNIGQAIYVSTSKSAVESNCTTGSCVIVDVSLTKIQNSYTTAQVLSPGSIYYYRVVSLDTYAICMASSSTKSALVREQSKPFCAVIKSPHWRPHGEQNKFCQRHTRVLPRADVRAQLHL